VRLLGAVKEVTANRSEQRRGLSVETFVTSCVGWLAYAFAWLYMCCFCGRWQEHRKEWKYHPSGVRSGKQVAGRIDQQRLSGEIQRSDSDPEPQGSKERRPRGSSETLVLQLEGGREAFELLYGIGEKIGHGSFGIVYACRDAGAAADVGATLPCGSSREIGPFCIKVLPVDGSNGHVSRASKISDDMQMELRNIFLEMKHENVVRYERFVQTSDALYVVMDRCCGPDLLEHVAEQGGCLAVEKVCVLARQMLGALAAVHSLRIMHRDVKLENFKFQDPSARVLKLLDFGMAKPAPYEPAAHTVTGTLCYAAPEVLDGFYSHKCDTWSAGAGLYVLLSGNLPFDTADVVMLRSMHRDPILTGVSLFRGKRWAAVPAQARSLVRGLLTVDPTVRLSGSSALGHGWLTGEAVPEDDLEFAAAAEGEASPTPSPRRPLKRCSRSINDMHKMYYVWNLAEMND